MCEITDKIWHMAVLWNYENTANAAKGEEKREVDHNP